MKRITVALGLSLVLLGAFTAHAQIKPDNTLGVDRSSLNNNTIQGGAQRGTNLFHSFSEFSIGNGQRVDFVNPVGVKNILTRVTDTPSNINGILGVLGGANLFFLNPNGIFFGTDARLDLTGTFVGSTGNGLRFSDGNVYSTVNPQAPLLTMTTPVGLQFGSNPGTINFTGTTSLLARDTITNYHGSSLLLAGGNINLTSAKLMLPNGKVELAAVNDVGSIDLDFNNLTESKSSSLTIPPGLRRGDITLQPGSTIATSGPNSGNIHLQGRNITIAGTDAATSKINARTTGATATRSGGNINLNATGDVVISGNFTGLSTSTLGGIQGGDIQITAANLQILDGAYLETSPYRTSSANGGNISIATTNTIKLGAPTNGEESDIITGSYGSGNSGNITIKTGKLIQGDGAQIKTDNLGTSYPDAKGKIGDIKIVALEAVEATGVSPVAFEFGFPIATGIRSFSTSQQDAGNIEIQTPKFSLRDGAVITAGADRSGNGGSISISGLNGVPATSVELLGNSNLSQFLGTENLPAFAGVGNGSRIRSITSNSGNAGSVKIKADRVTLQSGTRIDVSTLDRGQGGAIDIQAKTVELVNGGQLISTTKGSGQAGTINVQADKILQIDGTDPTFEAKRTFLSLMLVVSNQPATRQALGDYLQNPHPNSQQSVINSWQQVNHNSIDKQILQQYFAFLQTNPTARTSLQSYLTKTTGQTSLNDYNIFLNVGNNSGIISRSQPDSTGTGGNITITSPTLNIQNGGSITVNSNGSGRGGNITATTDTINLNRGSITAKTVSANGGDLNLTINKLLLLRNQSEISASAATNGNGGNISILAPNGLILAVPNENSDITASATGGQGGKININADNVLGFTTQRLDRFSNIAATSSLGTQGAVTINILGNDPNKGLQPDPIAPSTPTIAQTCVGSGDERASQFIDSGKGGVTPSAGEPLRSTILWSDPRMGTPTVSNPPPSPIIEEAQGWKIGSNRTVILTSQPTNNSAPMLNSTSPNCLGQK